MFIDSRAILWSRPSSGLLTGFQTLPIPQPPRTQDPPKIPTFKYVNENGEMEMVRVRLSDDDAIASIVKQLSAEVAACTTSFGAVVAEGALLPIPV